jgi:hypothetical protein
MLGTVADEPEALAELQRLLNDWDPIGVYDAETDFPNDEYDCLCHPILSRLQRGESAHEIAVFLQDDLRNHFGLNPNAADPVGFAERLVSWWRSRQSA